MWDFFRQLLLKDKNKSHSQVLNIGALGDREELCEKIVDPKDVRGFIKAKNFDSRMDGFPE